MEKALFGAGCFWGVEESFRKLPGVINTEVGYSGGNIDSPSYEVVCSGNTNHAEVVLVEFDETKISFENLVNHFWTCHDPTTLNRQGPEINSKIEYAKKTKLNIVTEISEAKKYFKAEEYHQKYIQKTGLFCAS